MRLQLHSVKPHTCFVQYRRATSVYDAAAGEAAVITDWKSNALQKIDANIPGTFLGVQADNEQRAVRLDMPMNGTRISVMLARRFCAAEYHYAEQERQNDTDERRRDNPDE